MKTPLEKAREALLEKLGLDRPPARFDEALTHPSWTNENRSKGLPDNQRLEFLGDGVLDLCVSEILLEAMPDADEGALSRAYTALVNTQALARWAKANDVGQALRFGRGAIADKSAERPNVLADAVEALVAAIYLDGGLEAARKATRCIIGDELSRLDALTARDPKSELQELVQAGGAPAPKYRTVSVEGPSNAPEFVVEVSVADRVVATGRASSKKQAEQNAAAAALEVLRKGSQDEGAAAPEAS